MQRVFNVDKWTLVEQGQSLAFSNIRPRNVRLDVNAPQETEIWYVCQNTGEALFLALVKGRDVLEFGCVGPFELTVKGGFVMVFTNDGDDISLAPTAEQAFVKVMERRRRNPELEHIAYVMEQNLNRRLEQQANELSQLFERRAAAAAEALRAGGTGDAGSQHPPATSSPTAPVGATANEGGTNNETEDNGGAAS